MAKVEGRYDLGLGSVVVSVDGEEYMDMDAWRRFVTPALDTTQQHVASLAIQGVGLKLLHGYLVSHGVSEVRCRVIVNDYAKYLEGFAKRGAQDEDFQV